MEEKFCFYQQDLNMVIFTLCNHQRICFYSLNRFKLLKISVQLKMQSVSRESLLLFIFSFVIAINPFENQKNNQEYHYHWPPYLPIQTCMFTHIHTHIRCPTLDVDDFLLIIHFHPALHRETLPQFSKLPIQLFLQLCKINKA